MSSRSPSTRVCTERRSVYGGSTATSVREKSCFLSARIQASFWTSATASGWVTFIFQLPAIRGVRKAIYVLLSGFGRSRGVCVGGSALEDGDARQLFALEQLETGAAAGGDVAERVLVEAELPHGCCRVATADDGQTADLCQRLCDGLRTLRERRRLEDAHRPVPEHGPRVA